jgi:hypothetical protein
VREFAEETCHCTAAEEWQHRIDMQVPQMDCDVQVFRAFTDDIQLPHTPEGSTEVVRVCRVDGVLPGASKVIDNLCWMVPLVLDHGLALVHIVDEAVKDGLWRGANAVHERGMLDQLRANHNNRRYG